ncbi:MAG: class I SAM-dependent methyltransferase [Gemmatimonadota bacterium]
MTEPEASPSVVRRHFDSVALEYETNRLGGWYTAHGRFIADALAGRRFRTVVDIGCGTGWLLRELHRRGMLERGIGLDLSPNMVDEAVRLARLEGVDDLEFHVCEWPDDIPASLAADLSDAVDLVVCASSLHYFVDIERALLRCRDLLAAGGTIAILERAPERSWPTRAWGRLHALILQDGVTFIDTGDLQEGLRRAGFQDIAVAGVLRRYFWKGKIITSMALSTACVPSPKSDPRGRRSPA